MDLSSDEICVINWKALVGKWRRRAIKSNSQLVLYGDVGLGVVNTIEPIDSTIPGSAAHPICLQPSFKFCL